MYRKIDFIEGLAETIKQELNNIGIDFRMDYDSDQTDKIEFGRKIARSFYRNMRAWQKHEERKDGR